MEQLIQTKLFDFNIVIVPLNKNANVLKPLLQSEKLASMEAKSLNFKSDVTQNNTSTIMFKIVALSALLVVTYIIVKQFDQGKRSD